MTLEFDYLKSPLLRGLASELDADGWQVSCERDAGDAVRIVKPRLLVYHDGDVYYVLYADGEVLVDSTEFGAIFGTLYGRMQFRIAEENDAARGEEQLSPAFTGSDTSHLDR